MPRMVQARDVPDEVYAQLSAAAGRRGQSLSQYVRGELTRLAEQAAVLEHNRAVFRRAERRQWRVSPDQIVAALDDARSGP